MTAAYDWQLDDGAVARWVGRHRRNLWKVAAFTCWTLAVYFWPHGMPATVVCVSEPAAPSSYLSDGGPVITVNPGFLRGDIR